MSALAPLPEATPPLQPEDTAPSATNENSRPRHKPIMSAGTGT